jgi:hypothetical protein
VNVADPAAAQECVVFARARMLSGWIGEGKPVTASAVLRRADVGRAAALLGLTDPGRVRTAADVPALHHVWVVAEAAGLIALDRDRAVAVLPDARAPEQRWYAALHAVLRAESTDRRRRGALVLCRAVLDVLTVWATPDPAELDRVVTHHLHSSDFPDIAAAHAAFRRGETPVTGAVELLAEFGALGGLAVTPLGRWAHEQLLAEREPPSAPALAGTGSETGGIYQLKIALHGFRPPVWRRLLVASDVALGVLHEIIQVAFGWDDDHLHVFTADGRGYTDPFVDLDGCIDESAVRLSSVLSRPGLSIDYRYDLGDCWDHKITLERTVDRDAARCYPSCEAGRGDAPVEDWLAETGEPPVLPFDQADINRQLARYGDAS